MHFSCIPKQRRTVDPGRPLQGRGHGQSESAGVGSTGVAEGGLGFSPMAMREDGADESTTTEIRQRGGRLPGQGSS
jgi:hypothetical protein